MVQILFSKFYVNTNLEQNDKLTLASLAVVGLGQEPGLAFTFVAWFLVGADRIFSARACQQALVHVYQ